MNIFAARFGSIAVTLRADPHQLHQLNRVVYSSIRSLRKRTTQARYLPYGILYGGRGWLVAHVDALPEMQLWRLDRIENR